MGAKVLIAEIGREKDQLKLLSGFEKDGQKFMEYSREIRGWIDDIRTLPETVNTRN